jgi:hypothetical protein
LTHEVRSGLKERDLLPKEDTTCTVHDSLRWTVQQRGNWRNYQPGQVVTLTKSIGGWKAGESASVARVESGTVVVVSGDQERTLPLKSAGSFDVAISRPIGVCPGDKILIRANARPLGLINGQVLTVEKIGLGGELHTREGVMVPPAFKQWTHGYVVTSHKAQGRTCERVVVAAARLDAKSTYVACSRGRESCSVHTPDKAALMSHLPEGNRKAALDVLATNPPKNLTADLRSTAYREITAQIRRIRAAVNRRTEQMGQMVRRHDHHRQRASITESMSGPRLTPAESERPHYDFSPVRSQKTGIGI